MKQKEYNVKVCFSETKLISCSCDCDAGGDARFKDSGVVCVYTLSLVYQFYILMCEGLAQHFLIELSNRWNDTFDTYIRGNENKVKTQIRRLLRCDGVDDVKIKSIMLQKTLKDILSKREAQQKEKKRGKQL